MTNSKLVVGVLVTSIVAVAGITHVYLPFYSEISEERRKGETFGIKQQQQKQQKQAGSMWKNMSKKDSPK